MRWVWQGQQVRILRRCIGRNGCKTLVYERLGVACVKGPGSKEEAPLSLAYAAGSVGSMMPGSK